MKLLDYVNEKFDPQETNRTFGTGLPYPMVELNDFLPPDFAFRMFTEAQTVPDEHWTRFTRNKSFMKECIKLEHCPVAEEFVNAMHSAAGMKWLSEVTGIPHLLGDPYIVGAGYSKSWAGDSLKLHTDFNWNDKLKLHRAASLIVYLTPDWNPEWGGDLQFWDFNREKIVSKVNCTFNNCVIWQHHKRGFHGYPDPITCPPDTHRTTFRLMFYTSEANYDPQDRPHRSLYWFDRDADEPYDIPTQR